MLAFYCKICIKRSDLCAICASHVRGLLFVSLSCCYGYLRASLHCIKSPPSLASILAYKINMLDVVRFLSLQISSVPLHFSFVISDLPMKRAHLVSKQHKQSSVSHDTRLLLHDTNKQLITLGCYYTIQTQH